MSKWTCYQLAVLLAAAVGLAAKHFAVSSVYAPFGNLPEWMDLSIVMTFIFIIGTVWGMAVVLYWQERKSGQLFTHKIWRILPALLGILFVVSFIGIIVLGVTIFSSITPDQQWQIDVILIYFLALIYLFILSVVLRYGKGRTPSDLIIFSANCTALVLLITLFFVPSL